MGIMMLASASAIPAMAGTAEAYPEEHNIYVSGKASPNAYITMRMCSKSDKALKYINETTADEAGNYSLKFKYTGDYSNCEMFVKEGDNDAENTVISVKEENVYPCGTITAGEFKDGMMNVNVNIKNKYTDGSQCKLIFSYYDANGALFKVESEDVSYTWGNTNIDVSKAVSENTAMAKVFLWESIGNPIPLAKRDVTVKDKSIVLIGDSLGQTYGANSCQKGWGEMLGKYTANGIDIKNVCHAGWDSVDFIYNTASGWDYAKSLLKAGDTVIFLLGHNDYNVKGYNGKYYELNGNGERQYFSNTGFEGTYLERSEDSQGAYITTKEFGKLYITNPQADPMGTSTYDEGYLTYFYKDENGAEHSYAADSYYDNMKMMLTDCKNMGVDVVLANTTTKSNGRPTTSSAWYGYRSMGYMNVKLEQLAAEFDNAELIDVTSETERIFNDVYNNADTENLPDYFYDENGELLPYINKNLKQQILLEKFWLTIHNYAEFYGNGEAVQNPSGKWGYKVGGVFYGEDDLHYNERGADCIAQCIAKLTKASASPAAQYFK